MKQQVLKALANPARIFYVPYMLAVINFAVLFVIYILWSIVKITFLSGDIENPLFFMIVLIVSHLILAEISKRDPQIGQIIASKVQLFKKKVPNRLVA